MKSLDIFWVFSLFATAFGTGIIYVPVIAILILLYVIPTMYFLKARKN